LFGVLIFLTLFSSIARLTKKSKDPDKLLLPAARYCLFFREDHVKLKPIDKVLKNI